MVLAHAFHIQRTLTLLAVSACIYSSIFQMMIMPLFMQLNSTDNTPPNFDECFRTMERASIVLDGDADRHLRQDGLIHVNDLYQQLKKIMEGE